VPTIDAQVLDRAKALLADASPGDVEVRSLVRTLAKSFAAQVPGRAVELRIPPHVAVQCVGGPVHKRGTPGNVVETDALTWLGLCVGRLRWTDVVAGGRVHASGARADLSSWLPFRPAESR
jgi:hypothetical protein